MNWTKGKWFVKESGGKGELVGVASEGSSWFIAEEVLPNDAHLIASAPELYEALEESLAIMTNLQEKHLSHCSAMTRAMLQNRITAAKAALAKARGEV